MKWLRENEAPEWVPVVGGLLLAIGCLIMRNVLLLGVSFVCVGAWLVRWWFHGVPTEHKRFYKMSKQHLHLYRITTNVSSWFAFILVIFVVCFSVFQRYL